ncbi:MAG: acyl carrier protein [Oscillibacter sp.]|jgi:acyl carrier protein|nr:acyl carrier protein [Oscillibacter sp.]
MEHLEEVIRVLEEVKPGVDYRREDNLFAGHILASLEIMMLVSELNDEFGITVTLPYIKPENFRSAQTICDMVETILKEE